jgi:hypothetical protein
MAQSETWQTIVQRFVETGEGSEDEAEKGWAKELAQLLDDREAPDRKRQWDARGIHGENPLAGDLWASKIYRAIKVLRISRDHPEIEETYAPTEREQRKRNVEQAKETLRFAATLADSGKCRQFK